MAAPFGLTLPFSVAEVVEKMESLLRGDTKDSQSAPEPMDFEAPPKAVLEKVARLPITQWTYKADPAATHLGPVAQDFKAAFALGSDDKAIATVDVSTSNFDPEFGNAGGAVTNVTLRSGTNGYHGSLFSFHRNENIQARNTFSTTKAPTVYNQFGAGTVTFEFVKNYKFTVLNNENVWAKAMSRVVNDGWTPCGSPATRT